MIEMISLGTQSYVSLLCPREVCQFVSRQPLKKNKNKGTGLKKLYNIPTNEDSDYDEREQLYKTSRCFLLQDLQFHVLKCQEI